MAMTCRLIKCLALLMIGCKAVFADDLVILMPAYANPCCGDGVAMWSELITQAQAGQPSLIAIFNPDNGPGVTTLVDPNYVNDVEQGPLLDFRAANGTLIGYVATGFAGRSAVTVSAEIDKYFDPVYWRGAGVQVTGIFFDEFSNDLNDVPYYQSLAAQVRLHLASALIIGNPGTSFTTNLSMQSVYTVNDYASSVDVLVTFENNGTQYRSNYTPPAWEAGFGPSNFAHIVHSEGGLADMRADLALTRSRGAGMVYITDDVLGNPYDRLPAYWTQQLNAALETILLDSFE